MKVEIQQLRLKFEVHNKFCVFRELSSSHNEVAICFEPSDMK